MTKFSVIHDVKCSGCGADFTQPKAVEVYFSEHLDCCLLSVDEEGHLQEPNSYSSVTRMIASGFHTGSYCAECKEQLEELVDDDEAQDQDKNWYVRWEGMGEITGPFSKEEALESPIAGDGMVFSSKIFEPQFVTTPEVEELIKELRSIREAMLIVRTGEDDAIGSLCQRAIDTITLFPAKNWLNVLLRVE